MKNKVAIIGAGVGGLATAARLASRGYQVEVYEKLDRCGGRTNIIEDKGFKFDTGPSFVLMPDYFHEVFSYAGENLSDYLTLKPLDVSYKIFYSDQDTLTVFKDSDKTKKELERIEKGSARSFEAFMQETEKIYALVKPLLYECVTLKALTKPYYWSLARKIRALESYWQFSKRFFKNEKLCFAFTFEAMFIGVSPFEAPAFYSVISYADHAQKIYHPLGGMYQVPLALEKLAKKFGATFFYNSAIDKIVRHNGTLALKRGSQEIKADKIVVNADYAYAQADLLGKRLKDLKYSCSVLLIYLGTKKKIQGLQHHNIFFSKDLRKNLKQIFDDGLIPEDPSFYIHVPTVTDPGLAPENKDIVYILVPVANLRSSKIGMQELEEKIIKTVYAMINRRLGIKIEDLIEVKHMFYPTDFLTRYNVKYGATFGLAHTLFQSAFFRPANFDRRIDNLYFVGASTQPGGGLPVVLASSRIVSDLIESERQV